MFSKISEKECEEVPFYYDEATGLEFYFDDCHTGTYECEDGKTYISTDTTQYIENEDKHIKKACNQVMQTSSLEKRKAQDCTTFNMFFTAIMAIASIAPTTRPVLIATTGLSRAATYACSLDSPEEDKCCKEKTSCVHSQYGACYTNKECITLCCIFEKLIVIMKKKYLIFITTTTAAVTAAITTNNNDE
ncbi:hypothetical protein PIROE2DRAFT_16501 [Piromyces sp. E2]|nr:hypothetical protein PIROE2DRAFT_16501 [Piromyces sp. E2]|eukprot:OUM58270.1 hypothetical protein PIROE2DRAFT_16501 [Piromyces sp. E2]